MSNSGVKLASANDECPMSHTKNYTVKATEKDKLPALNLGADAKAEAFPYVLKVAERNRSTMRV